MNISKTKSKLKHNSIQKGGVVLYEDESGFGIYSESGIDEKILIEKIKKYELLNI